MNTILNRLVSEARRRRAQHLHRIVDEIADRNGECRIIDVGGEAHYWRSLDLDRLQARNVRITLVNVKPEPIDHSIFTSAVGDGCNLSQYADNSFDLAHSNSTLEHVGEWSQMRALSTELHRLAPNHYVQTPNFWFPIEPHFLALGFHWMPEALRVKSLLRRRHGHHGPAETVDEAIETVRSARLLDRAQFAALFPRSQMRYERFGGLTKSLIAVGLAPS